MMNDDNGTVVAITGGFASGKSTVAEYIQGLGYKVIYTDDFTKKLMAEFEPLKKELINEFGSDTYSKDGSLNKDYLKNKVFCAKDECKKNLSKLNSIVHPYVLVEREKLIEEYIDNGATHVFVESALIYEAGIEEFFDYVVCVYANEETVIRRALAKGLTENEVRQRLESQMSPEEKRKLADFVIDNKGNLDDLKKAVDFIVSIL
jgi:dephospho-CoA kinase